MDAVITEAKIPYTIDLLESILDYEEFKYITWGIEPVNGVYEIRESIARYYGIIR